MTPKAHQLPLKNNNLHEFKFDAIHFKIISHIETCQSLAEIAKKLSVTRSAISQRLAEMEDICKITLAHRKPLQLTEAGELFLSFAKETHRNQDALKLKLSKLRSTDITLRVMAVDSILIGDATPVMTDTLREFIHLNAVLMEGNGDEIARAVLENKTDIGLIDAESKKSTQGLIFDKYRSAQIVLLANKDHPLCSKTRIKLEEMISYRAVDLPDSNFIMHRLRGVQLMRDVYIHFSFRVPNLEIAAHRACTSDGGLCFTLEDIAKRHARVYDAKIVYLDEPWVFLDFYTITREIERRSEAMNYFISLLRKRF